MTPDSYPWAAVAATAIYGIGRAALVIVSHQRLKTNNLKEAHRLYQRAVELRDQADVIDQKPANERSMAEAQTLREYESTVSRAERCETEVEFSGFYLASLGLWIPSVIADFAGIALVVRFGMEVAWPAALIVGAILAVILHKLSVISEECSRLVRIEFSKEARQRSREEDVSYQQALREFAQYRYL